MFGANSRTFAGTNEINAKTIVPPSEEELSPAEMEGTTKVNKSTVTQRVVITKLGLEHVVGYSCNLCFFCIQQAGHYGLKTRLAL